MTISLCVIDINWYIRDNNYIWLTESPLEGVGGDIMQKNHYNTINVIPLTTFHLSVMNLINILLTVTY